MSLKTKQNFLLITFCNNKGKKKWMYTGLKVSYESIQGSFKFNSGQN
jgi:hypothetical protein